MNEKLLSTLPLLLQPEVHRLWQDYLTCASLEDQACLVNHPQVMDSLPKVWGCSLFVAQQCIQYPSLLTELIKSGDLLKPPEYPLMVSFSEQDLMKALRQFRRREMLRIAWRDLAHWAPLEETLQSLSNLADTLIETALSALYSVLTLQFGVPYAKEGVPQQLVVLAMGKLGGQELNFSSDIDLIFAYPEAGETVGVKRPRTHQEFFTRLGQQLIHALSHVTADGFVFRVDMRLRPFGDSGPLAINFSAMEEYYQAHARDWERYAMVKARVVAGDKEAGHLLLKILQPFVYRRYLDFNAFEALRNMKALIDQETNRKGLNNNIKLGPGGIREVEFTCQVFQLIRGGRQPALQQRHLLSTLQHIENYQLLPSEVVHRLRQAYYFLRLTENHLQAIEDRQTQTLPEEPLNKIRLAYSLGFPDWNSFIAHLIHHQQAVHQEFEQIILPSAYEKHSPNLESWQTLWSYDLQNDEKAYAALHAAGFEKAQEILARLRQLVDSTSKKLSQRGRERLNTLIPLLIATTLGDKRPDEAILRLLGLIEAVAQRSVYLSLLIERPQVLKQLVHLCSESAWITEQITRYPLLLDELIDPRRLYEPLKPEELDNALCAQLAHFSQDDSEMQLDCLCQFKRAHVLHVAFAEISGNITLELTSDHLTAIADTLIKKTLSMAWNALTQKYGQPFCHDGEERRIAGFCVIGYGKVGGIELNYGSDLDLVFLHDSQGTQQMTESDKPLSNNVFFARLAQRIIHILTVKTPAGVLYEVDQRLRPSGLSGLLVSSLEAYETYQKQDAWTWEHQALVRARPLAGDQVCIDRFRKIRAHILSLPRNPEKLKQEVQEMRVKMRESLDQGTKTLFDLKQGPGGIVDIEFMIQYGVLRWASVYPDLLETTAMLRLLKLLGQYQLFEEQVCLSLRKAYRTYRTEVHRLTLQNQKSLVGLETFLDHRQEVSAWWQKIFM